MTMNDLRSIWHEWEVEKELGTGSFGTVYKVVRRDYELESYAAIKVITIPSNESEVESLRSDGYDMKATKTYFQEIVNDFVNEIRLMESLKGMQNIVSVEDYKVVENSDKFGWTIYIRMELLTPFNTYTCDKKLTEAEVIKLGCDICSALEICSKRNIIHRDIKPENIFINDFGYFKLGDFGIARKMENMTSGLSRVGSPNYMAPEVASGRDYDSSVDIYSLGLVLYKLLNGNRLPFLDKKQIYSHGDKMNALNRRLGGEALPVPCDASPAMAKLILRACAYDPSKRFSSATEMKEALACIGNNYHKEISKDKMERDEVSRNWQEREIKKELGSIGNNSERKTANYEIEEEKEKRAIGGEILDGSNIVRISADAIERCKNKRNKQRKLWDETDSLNARKPILYLNKDVVAKEEFSGREDFNILVLGENVKSLEDKAFCGCVNLEYIYIVGEHIRIGSYAFSRCSKLKYVIYQHVPTDEQQYENKLFRKKLDYFANDVFNGCGELKMCSDYRNSYLNNYCKKNNLRYYNSNDSELSEEFYGICGLIHESGLNWRRKKKANVYVVKEEPDKQMKNNVHKVTVSNANTILTEPEKVFQEYYAAARDGDSEAQFNLAECFANGTGTERDIDEALKWYSSAANQGNDDATVKLYSLCLEKNEEEKALSILQVAAENGNWQAMICLAHMYEEGLVVEVDNEIARYWYEESGKAFKESQKKSMQRIRENHSKSVQELRENQKQKMLDWIEQRKLQLQDRMERS